MICPVQILGSDGSGSNSGVISGINFVVGKCKGAAFRCVINMSIGGGFNSQLNSAVATAVDNGIVVVVAAGNDYADNACNYSPSSAAKAVTVGSTTSSDAKSDFSNIGSCVDVYAPGSDIKSAYISSNTATKTMSGTSMATPRTFVSLFSIALSIIYGHVVHTLPHCHSRSLLFRCCWHGSDYTRSRSFAYSSSG